jgi:opacity protein-like surface antigen
MKKRIIFIVMLAAGVFISPFVSAQSSTSVLYSIGIPMGALKDHTNNVSGRGTTIEYQKFIKPNISVGVNFAYSVFYEEKPYGSYNMGTATLTGYQYRYNNLFPMLVNGQYHFLSEGMIKPYLGLGIGTVYNLRNTDMGTWTIEENNWHFLMSPEAGVVINVSPYVGIKVNAKYDNAFKISEADGFANLNFNFGVVFHSGVILQ